MPLWAVLFSICFLGEKVNIYRFAAIVLGMLGLGVLISGELGILKTTPLGVVFMLIAAISWGAGTVIQKKIEWEISALSLVIWQLIFGGLPITVGALFIESYDWSEISYKAAGSTLFILFIAIILSWFAWFKVIKILPVPVFSLATLLVPILGGLSSLLLLGEPIGWRELLSLVLICSSLALVIVPTRSSS